MKSYLFDTNILIDHLRRHKSILSFVRQCQSDGFLLRISAMTRAEIKAGQSIEHLAQAQKAENLLSIFTLIPIDKEIADQAGELKRKFSLNLIDAIIAASAILTESILITRNTKHFLNIPELKIKSKI